MNASLKNALAVLLISIMTFSGVKFIHGQYLRQVSQLLSDQLRTSQAQEIVSARGTTYTVTSGSVLRVENNTISLEEQVLALQLAYKKRMARVAPLLAMPGVDPNQFLDAVVNVQNAQERHANEQETTEQVSLIRNGLYPIHFLESMARTEMARLQFLSSGSDVDAHTYERAQDDSIKAYVADMQRFKFSFSMAVPSDTTQEFVTQKNIISRSSILSALSQMKAGIDATQTELLRRRACVRGHESSCNIRNLSLPELPDVPTASAATISRAQDIASLLKEAGFPMEMNSPFVLLDESTCFAPHDDTEALFSFQIRKLPNGVSYASPVFVGDIQFVESNTQRKVPLFDLFASKGVDLVYQNLYTYYTCPELGHDTGILLAIRDVIKLAQTNSLSDYATGHERDILKQLENQFIYGKYVTRRTAVTYLQTAYIVAETSHSIPVSVRDEIITRWLQLAYGSTGAYLTMRNIDFFQHTPKLTDRNGTVILLDAFNMYFARSAFPTLFMWNNASVGNMYPLFPLSDPAKAMKPYVFYSDMLNRKIDRKQIRADISSYYFIEISGKK